MEIVDSMPNSGAGARRSARGPEPKYNWAEIFDGQPRHFALADIPGTPRNFGRQVRTAAARHGVRVTVIVRSKSGVYVQRQ